MTPITILFYALLVLQFLDMISTIIALRNPNLIESNLLLAPIFKQFGALPTLLVLKLIACAYIYYSRQSISVEVLALLDVGYAYVVAKNFYLIKITPKA